MSTHIASLLFHRKWILAVTLPILIAAWWAFRPEKLWINQKVNEAAPFASSSDPQPLYTGRLQGEAHQTSGRATIYKAANGTQYLRLTDFSTSHAAQECLRIRLCSSGSGEETTKGRRCG